MNRSFFCFIHIPKCGGLSFDDILRRNLRQGYQRFPHHLYEGPIPAFNLKLYIEESISRVGMGSHRLSLDLPFADVEACDLKAISFVRNPIERIRSEFFYLKQLPGNVGQNPLIRQFTYPDYLQHLLKNPSDLAPLAQSQINYLFGKLSYSNDTLKKLVDSKQVLLFPLERFDHACLYLEKTFPNYFTDASFAKQNVNPKQPSQESASLESAVSAQLTMDNNLVAIAHQQTDRLISEAFSPKELSLAQQQFDRRCRKRRLLYEPVQKLTRKLYQKTALW